MKTMVTACIQIFPKLSCNTACNTSGLTAKHLDIFIFSLDTENKISYTTSTFVEYTQKFFEEALVSVNFREKYKNDERTSHCYSINLNVYDYVVSNHDFKNLEMVYRNYLDCHIDITVR